MSARSLARVLTFCLLPLPALSPAAEKIFEHRFDGAVTLLTLSDRARHAAASVGQDGGVRLIDVSTRRFITLRPLEGYATILRFSPDGRWLLTGSVNGHVRLVETATGKTLVEGQAAKRFSVENGMLFVTDPGLVDFSPDSKWLAVADCSGQVKLWAVDDLTRVGWFQRLRHIFSSYRPLPEPGVIPFPGHRHCQVRFNQDSRRLYIGHGRQVATVDLANGRIERTDEGDPRGNRLVLSPTGAHATLLYARGGVAFVSQALGTPPMPGKELMTEEEFFRTRVDGDLLFSRAVLNGSRFLIVTQRARYGVYSGDLGEELQRPTYFPCLSDYARAHSPYTDDRNSWYLTTCAGNKTLVVRDMDSDREVDQLNLEDLSELRDRFRPYVLSATADSRARLIATGSPDGWLRLWRVRPAE